MTTQRTEAIDIRIHLSLLMMATVAISLIFAGSARADIFTWTDEKGVIHFTNYDVPPKAEFYMTEQISETPAPLQNKSIAPAEQSDPVQAQLEEANHKLSEALDKVVDLTEKVEQTRQEAKQAADAARRAEAEAKTAGETRQEQMVVYSYPHRHHKYKPRPEPYYWKHNTDDYAYYNAGRHANDPAHPTQPTSRSNIHQNHPNNGGHSSRHGASVSIKAHHVSSGSRISIGTNSEDFER